MSATDTYKGVRVLHIACDAHEEAQMTTTGREFMEADIVIMNGHVMKNRYGATVFEREDSKEMRAAREFRDAYDRCLRGAISEQPSDVDVATLARTFEHLPVNLAVRKARELLIEAARQRKGGR